MIYRIFLIFFALLFLNGCKINSSKINYDKKELDENSLQTAHSILRPGSLIKIINIKTNESIILRVDKRFDYPEFYKLVITQAVADKLNLQNDLPLIEVIEV